MLAGFLNVNKPAGITSASVVGQVKRALQKYKVGHTGTLDPIATGVMILSVGDATRLSSLFSGQDKTYRALVQLGVSTDTFDCEGNITHQRRVDVDQHTLQEAVKTFKGKQKQTPPIFSAIRMGGERLYHKARRGEHVIVPERDVFIHDISIPSFDLSPSCNEMVLDVSCSSGTYIRSIIHDLGEKLHCGAHMKGLIRTSVGKFDIKESIDMEQLLGLSEQAHIEKKIISINTSTSELPSITLGPLEVELFVRGGINLPNESSYSPQPFIRVLNKQNELVGTASLTKEENGYKAKRISLEFAYNSALHAQRMGDRNRITKTKPKGKARRKTENAESNNKEAK